jgi:UDPglucose 6-dehydrogenase
MIGFVGLGKLGLPTALAINVFGEFEVMGFDIAPERRSLRVPPEVIEQGFDDLKTFEEVAAEAERGGRFTFAESYRDLVAACDLIFVAVQTPHGPEYEGTSIMPEERADFDYSALIAAMEGLAQAAAELGVHRPVAIISTVLPGTIDREIRPRIGAEVKRNERTRRELSIPWLDVVYNPSFIAMGQTIRDYLEPEFILVGGREPMAAGAVVGFYESLQERLYQRIVIRDTEPGEPYPPLKRPPIRLMSIPSAELTKVAYNTYITMKITFANVLMEVCEATPLASVDDVTDALALATRRLTSPAYLRAGMQDGGACHPRDNIALSWLSEQLGLSADLFGFLVRAREQQTAWLAKLAIAALSRAEEPVGGVRKVYVLGATFKPKTHITTGSPALLLASMLRVGLPPDLVEVWDPTIGWGVQPGGGSFPTGVYVIATAHEEFRRIKFRPGSVVIDPHRMLDPQAKGVEVVALGQRSTR